MKTEINQEAKALDTKVRNFCLSQTKRWQEVYKLACELEDKNQFWWVRDCAERGLYPIYQDKNLFVHLQTGQIVMVVKLGFFTAAMSDVLSVAANIERVVALSPLTMLKIKLRKQTKPATAQAPSS